MSNSLLPGIYLIRSFKTDLPLSIDTAYQPIDFTHVPLITGFDNTTKWDVQSELSGSMSIRLYQQQNDYVATENYEGGIFVTAKENLKQDMESQYLISPAQSTLPNNFNSDTCYTIQVCNTSDQSQTKKSLFMSNGFMNQVTIATTSNDQATDASLLWTFKRVSPGSAYESYGYFFEQDVLRANAEGVGPVYPRFGLKLQHTWDSFWKWIDHLNNGDGSVSYKVFFLERHGRAVNNLHASDRTALDLRDAPLVQDGFIQAQHVRSIWVAELTAGIGLPQVSWCSPFTRVLVTNTITLGDLPGTPPLTQTVIVENCRERCSTSEAEHRHSKRYIQEMFPHVVFEQNFYEDPNGKIDDPLWPKAESDDDVNARVENVLHRIFTKEEGKFIYIATHQGWIDAFCRVLGRAEYLTPNGIVLPIIVKYTPTLDTQKD